jgi:tetratricopeptide (TPR) repeat protein
VSDQIRKTLKQILDGVDVLVDSGDYGEALKILEKLAEICPDDPGPYVKRAEILSGRGRGSEAHGMLDLAEKRCAPSALKQIWKCRARLHESSGDMRTSASMLQKVVELEPRDEDAWFDLGRVLTELGDHRGTISALKRLLELRPDNPAIWSSLGTAYYNLGMYENSVKAYESALQADPTNEIRWYNKGNALLELGKFNDSVLCFDRVLEHDPNWIEAWNNRGVALDRAGQLKEAEESFVRALSLKPDYALAKKNITIIRAKIRGEDVDDDWLGLDTDEG